ncbi:MAG TPA: GNAT family N-acetyltransferase [Prolixibacteraceae bacterium]|jgi:hypothetical protein
MEILQKEDHNKGMFYISRDSYLLAKMTYVWAGTDKIIITHTVVNDNLKGQGIGKQLVEKAVSFAREKGIKIIPLCPFVKSVLSKGKEYNDVI